MTSESLFIDGFVVFPSPGPEVMGIPKFFRWLSERYPMTSQLVSRNMVPEFDNLYLDMNGIIHNCAKEYDPEKEGGQRNEEEIMIAIFSYIQTLFEIIRPQKLFFLAVDGVAPRAKMNQQRSRRFRAAKEAEEEAAKEAKRMAAKGQTRSETAEPKFDGNCITPGTEFMHKMAQHLRYFIAKKVNEESSWQGLEIIFSGPDVPGEGEHKIMEYIRCSKGQPGYDPNIRHCLYGLDADLILLGLLSHDPHFALLREEVLFGPAGRKPRPLSQTRFFLMHLSLLRDYIDAEFRSFYSEADGSPFDYESLPFEHYSIERLLDDIILMTVFVGNDFLPGLPYLHIGEGALGVMLDAYKRIWKSSGGKFMNNGGVIDFKQVSLFLRELCSIEREQFDRTGAALLSRAKAVQGFTARQKTMYALIRAELLTNSNADAWKSEKCVAGKEKRFAWQLASDFDLTFAMDPDGIATLKKGYNTSDDADSSSDEWRLNEAALRAYDQRTIGDIEDELDDEEAAEKAFEDWRMTYYKEKLAFDTPDQVKMLVDDYLTGIQWNMFYYYRGVVDWAWYFPYHYGPYLTDVAALAGQFECDEFNLGKPYAPLEQLLAVLPAASATHVPPAFAALMTEADSPIIDFYPEDFKTDSNGKKTPWEAVVLIPFIDEERLLDAVEMVSSGLSPDEVERNRFGTSTLFRFDASMERVDVAPPPETRYGPLIGVRVHVLQYDLPVLDTHYSFQAELLPGVHSVAGFPSLKARNVRHMARLESIGLVLFGGRPSAGSSLVLEPTVKDSGSLAALLDLPGGSVEKVAGQAAGERMFFGWPHLQEGLVVRLTDGLFSYDKQGKRALSEAEQSEHSRTLSRLVEDHRRIVAIDLPSGGNSECVLVWMAPLQGLTRAPDGSTKKAYAAPAVAIPHPAALVIKAEACMEDGRWVETAARLPREEYPVGSLAVYVGKLPHYGSLCRVIGHSSDGKSINIEVEQQSGPQPTFPAKLAESAQAAEVYFPARDAAQHLGISPIFLAKITSAWYLFHAEQVMDKASNIGLGLKFDGRGQCAAGYARRREGVWEFSPEAIHLIEEYRKTFPELFRALHAVAGARQTLAAEVFKGNADASTPTGLARLLGPVRAWIKSKSEGLRIISVDSHFLEVSAVMEIHSAWQAHAASLPSKPALVSLREVPPTALRHEGMAEFISAADATRFRLGDRTRYVGSGAAGIPFGTSGIVIGLEESPSLAHLLLDAPLPGVGKSLNGLTPSHHGVSVPRHFLLNLTHGSKTKLVTKQMANMSIKPVPSAPKPPVKENAIPPSLSALFSAASSSLAQEQERKGGPVYNEVAPPPNLYGKKILKRTEQSTNPSQAKNSRPVPQTSLSALNQHDAQKTNAAACASKNSKLVNGTALSNAAAAPEKNPPSTQKTLAVGNAKPTVIYTSVRKGLAVQKGLLRPDGSRT